MIVHCMGASCKQSDEASSVKQHPEHTCSERRNIDTKSRLIWFSAAAGNMWCKVASQPSKLDCHDHTKE